jgi:hypothetical protein
MTIYQKAILNSAMRTFEATLGSVQSLSVGMDMQITSESEKFQAIEHFINTSITEWNKLQAVIAKEESVLVKL